MASACSVRFSLKVVQGQQDTVFHGQSALAVGHIGELVAVLDGLDQAE